MFSFKNFKKHPLSTLGGAVLGLLQSGITSAAIAYTQDPTQVTDWKPYAAAAAVGATTFAVGGMLSDNTPAIPRPVVPDIPADSVPEIPAVPETVPAALPTIPPEILTALNQFLVTTALNQLKKE